MSPLWQSFLSGAWEESRAPAERHSPLVEVNGSPVSNQLEQRRIKGLSTRSFSQIREVTLVSRM